MTTWACRVAVFLFPAVVGGGLGDIDEVLVAGAALQRAGFPLYLYRRPGRPRVRELEGPWRWPQLARVEILPAGVRRAVTVAPAWGVSAAEKRPGVLGAPGPWGAEAREVEDRYGRDQTLHISLEEFARDLPSGAENTERYREAGWPMHRIARRRAEGGWTREVRTMHREYRRFRDFDRPNLLHLFGCFRPSRAFAREFTEGIQTGPLWPAGKPAESLRSGERPGGPLRWCWYASPSSATALVPGILAGFANANVRGEVVVRSPRPISLPRNRWVRWRVELPQAPERWDRVFARANLRIVTGSRTLLEALKLGEPWLYFNGVTGVGPSRRRHRPEKIDSLLEGWPQGPGAEALRRDLRDFARARRVAEVVASFVRHPDRHRELYRQSPTVPLAPPYDDQGAFLVAVVRRWLAEGVRAPDLVRAVRGRLLDLTPPGP